MARSVARILISLRPTVCQSLGELRWVIRIWLIDIRVATGVLGVGLARDSIVVSGRSCNDALCMCGCNVVSKDTQVEPEFEWFEADRDCVFETLLAL